MAATAMLVGIAGSSAAAGTTVDLGARPVFLVATDADADASVAAPVAVKASAVVLYTTRTTLPAATADYLSTHQPTAVVLVGGPAVISDAQQAKLAATYPVTRYGGATRQETAVQLAELSSALPAQKSTPQPGAAGATGPAGGTGPTGASGPAGAAGPGVAAGGTTGQVLSKVNSSDYNTAWTTPVTTAPLNLGVYRATARQYISGGAVTALSFDPAVSHVSGSSFDVPANYSGGPSGTFDTMTAPADGFYQVSGSLRLATTNSSATGTRYLALAVTGHGQNNSTLAEAQDVTAQTGYNTVLPLSQTVWLYQGDYIRLILWNGTNQTLNTDPDNYSRLTIAQLPLKQPIG